eukprot:16427564-Heterocapsa_arctica.AAC.1
MPVDTPVRGKTIRITQKGSYQVISPNHGKLTTFMGSMSSTPLHNSLSLASFTRPSPLASSMARYLAT